MANGVVFVTQPQSLTEVIQRIGSLASSDRLSMLGLMEALYLDLNNLRSQYALLQAALAAGTAVGGGYSTFGVAATQYFIL
jgi:hypothetical protein